MAVFPRCACWLGSCEPRWGALNSKHEFGKTLPLNRRWGLVMPRASSPRVSAIQRGIYTVASKLLTNQFSRDCCYMTRLYIRLHWIPDGIKQADDRSARENTVKCNKQNETAHSMNAITLKLEKQAGRSSKTRRNKGKIKR